MQSASVQVSPRAALNVRQVGVEQTPLIVIDDFAADTAALIEHACRAADYGPDATSAYPGVRARLQRDYVVAVLNHVFRLLFQVYRVPAELDMRPVNAMYSLIATPENELSLAQRVPHFDSNRPYYLALLHYLNPGDFCATGLFRHRPTGYERISEERLPRFLETSEAYLSAHGEPPCRYINASDGHYELYERIGYRANRLVVYPGNLLHSGLVDPGRDIDPDPRTGRLTANIFVDFRPAAAG